MFLAYLWLCTQRPWCGQGALVPCAARPPAPPALAIASRTRRGANPSGLGCVWTGSSLSLSGPVGLVLCLSTVAADPGWGWLRGARQTRGGALGTLHRRKGRCVRQKASPHPRHPAQLRPDLGEGFHVGWGAWPAMEVRTNTSSEAGPSVSWKVGVGGQASAF